MAPTKHFSMEVEGLDEIFRMLYLSDVRIRDSVWDLLDDLRKRGEYYTRLYAPAHTGELLRNIKSERPGPAMGPAGPELEAVVGVKQTGSKKPFWIHQGTGLYNRTDPKYITGHGPRGLMSFQKQGEERRVRPRAKGQKANPFMLYAFQQLVPYARGRVHLMMRRGLEGL